MAEGSYPGVARNGSTPLSVHRVALGQKALLWIILAQIALQLAMYAVPIETDSQAIPAFVLFLGIGVTVIAGLVTMILLAVATKRSVVSIVLLSIGAVIPLIGIFVLLSVNMRATRQLREAGLRVGFMGVPWRDIRRLKGSA